MRSFWSKAALLSAGSFLAFGALGSAQAQEQTTEEDSLEEIVVTGEIQYRNRTSTVAPVLVYDQQYFGQFEPLSVGDQLARVPGVAFTSDIGEHDAPQMRGLGEGYTQVLVNGRPIPGAGNDRTVFVDRIPAEIIDRIEIVRAPSADIDSQGVGGTINIILKDGMGLPPGVIARVGGIYDTDNEELNGFGALSLSGRTDDRRLAWSATIDAQTRYNVKVLDQQVFDDSAPGFATSFDGANFFQPDVTGLPGTTQTQAVEHQDQIDTRDSTDLSFNGDLTIALANDHTLRLDAFILDTDRTETEDGVGYERDDAADVWDIDDAESQAQRTSIGQQSYGVSALYQGQLNPSWSLESEARYANFQEDSVSSDFSADLVDVLAGDPLEPEEQERIESDDTEMSIDAALTFNSDSFAQNLGLAGFEFEVGGALRRKTRDYALRNLEWDDGAGIFEDDTAPGSSGVFEYEENRYDAWIMAEAHLTPALTIQVGVRSENTETESNVVGAPSLEGSSHELNPSVNVRWNVTENGQFRASYARTVRRPGLDQLVPFADEESPGDLDITQGNPDLDLETAWGYDIGYEHRLGQRGVIGFNYFHRDVSDVISLVNTGVDSGITDGPDEGSIYTYRNTGDGEVSGWEVDISTPLDFIGLSETGFFANYYTDLDSERTEPLTGLRAAFNAQPEYVFNVGLTQNIPSWNTSFGFSYREQGRSVSTFLGEVEEQWYDANLEVFVEHRLANNLVLRVVGSNLLDADSLQAERGFDGVDAEEIAANQIAGIVDAFEVERENSSPTILVSLRAVF